jgi:GAF domain-containing protein
MSIHTTAPFPDNAEQRLATLGEYALLDSPSEALFNSLAGLAARLCATPISMIALVDRDRHLFKASVGLNDLSSTVCESAFCAQAITSNGIVEIPDALLDARFVDDPLVRNDPYIRFYAAAPLTVAGGQTLGTLCVIDREPRTLSAEQRSALSSISAAVVEHRHAHAASAVDQRCNAAQVGVYARRSASVIARRCDARLRRNRRVRALH